MKSLYGLSRLIVRLVRRRVEGEKEKGILPFPHISE